MNLKKVFLITVVLLILPISFKLLAGDFGQSVSLFTDIKAHNVGDILTINIYENAKASTQAETKTQKSNSGSAQGGPGTGPLDFIPLFGADYQISGSFNGKGENLRNQSLRARMSVTIIGVKSNGDLIIKGTRTIGISTDKETITLTGVVRPKDIKANNMIDSYLIADAEISYTGKGAANTSSRPGIVSRIVNWLF